MTQRSGACRPERVDRLVGQLRRELTGAQRHERQPVGLNHALVRDAAPFGLGQREELLGVLHQGIAELGDAPRALLGRGASPRPGVEGPPRGADRRVHVSEAGVWRLRDRRLGRRIDVVVAAALGRDPPAVDVERI